MKITNNERKKEYLEDYRYNKLQYDLYMNELEALEERRKGLSSRVLDGLPRGNVGSHIDSKWVDLMDYNDELIRYLGVLMEDMKEELEIVTSAINELPSRERAVLTARYIKGMSFREIDKIMPCSERTMYSILENGIELIELPI